MEQQVTFCRLCESYCGVVVEVDGDRVGRVTSDPEHPLSRGHLCVKGTVLGELHHDPDRLRHPARKTVSGQWETVTWDQALDGVAQRLRAVLEQHGGGAVAFYFGVGSFPSGVAQPAVNALIRELGGAKVYSTMTIDCAGLNRAAGAVLGDATYAPFPDWERSRYMLVLGHNPVSSRFGQFQTQPRGLEAIRAARRAGGRMVLVDPRRTESARHADEHHFIVPGTDLFLVLALLHTVVAEELSDPAFVAAHCDGFQQLSAAVTPWRPERAAALTGIPAETIRCLAREFATAEAAFCIGHTGVTQGPHATLAQWAILALNAITGNFDRPGGLRWNPPATRALPVGLAPRRAQGPRACRIGGFSRFLGEFPTATLADEILTPGPGQVRALVVVGGNPVLSFPNSGKVAEALSRLDLLVCVDLYVNQTGSFAHYVLPAQDQLERPDVSHPLLARNSDLPFVQFTPPLVQPKGEVRPEWWIFRSLAQRLQLSPFQNEELESRVTAQESAGADLDTMTRTLLDEMLAPTGWTTALLKAHPHGVILGNRQFGAMREHGWPTANGRVQLAPAEFVAVLQHLDLTGPGAPVAAKGDPPFYLIGRRMVSNYNTWLRNLPSLVRAVPENTALINASDAERLGIEPGQSIYVYNHVGQIRIPAQPTPDVAPGVVVIPHGWGHHHSSGQHVARRHPGANPNALIDDRALEPFTGSPSQNGSRVWISVEPPGAGGVRAPVPAARGLHPVPQPRRAARH